jgi:hypothetical protein
MSASRRATLVAAAVAAPAVLMALALTVVEAWRAVEPQAAIFGGTPPASMVDSIAGRYGVEETYTFIRNGQDPNGLVAVTHPDYTGRETVRVSPLMLAVAARDSSAVRMLLTFGARLDLPQNARAICLAREIGNEEISSLLDAERNGASPVACPPRRDAPTPLVAWAE